MTLFDTQAEIEPVYKNLTSNYLLKNMIETCPNKKYG